MLPGSSCEAYRQAGEGVEKHIYITRSESMKIAIHAGEGDFSKRWIDYCQEKKLVFEIVDCFDSDIIDTLRDFDILLWHWRWIHPESQLAARQIVASIDKMNIVNYPNLNTCWHYDDKLGQKYLLESISAPTIKTWVFYDKKKALKWINDTEFPKVFKLRCGSASVNVSLVKNKKEAIKLCTKAFHNGFIPRGSYFSDTKTKIKTIKNRRMLFEKIKRIPQSLQHIAASNRVIPRQIGYVYFQEFLPGNDCDLRIIILGGKAFGKMRKNRENDFRASGSGVVIHDPAKVDLRCVKIAFETARKIGAQSLAFDFLWDRNGQPRIAEMSYCFPERGVKGCPGWWDENLGWHEGSLYPQDLILESMVDEYQRKITRT